MRTSLGICYAATGHMTSAAMLYRLRYFLITRGMPSVELSLAQWNEELNLSKEQVKDGYKRLRALDLITTASRPKGGVLVHLSAQGRLVLEAAASHNGRPQPLASGPSGRLQPPASYIGGSKVGEKEGASGDTAAPIARPIGESVMKYSGKSVQEIMEQSAKPEHKVRPKALPDIWRDAYISQDEGSWCPPLTIKEKSMLKLAAGKMPPGKVNDVIDYVVRHWPEFVAEVRTSQGTKTGPVSPSIPYFLRYAGQAYQLWYSAETPAGATKKPLPALVQVANPQPAPAPVALEDDDKPTLDEILAPYKPPT